MVSANLCHLSDDEVRSLQPSPRAVRVAVISAFRAYASGAILCKPKTSLQVAEGHAFQTLSAIDLERGLAISKWIGMVPPASGIDCVNASIQLSDVKTGRLLCIMNAQHATALRTAGMSAQAAHLLARPESSTAGFIGAGVQASSHLEALIDLFPLLRKITVHSRTEASSRTFAKHAVELGLHAEIASPQEVISGSDIVITSVPGGAQLKPFLDPRWLRPGAFAAAVDLGRPWIHAPLSEIDLLAVDDEPMKTYAQPGNLVPPLSSAHATLAELCAGIRPGRQSGEARTMYFSSGSAVADLAVAVEIYRLARDTGIGTWLPH